MTRTRNATFHGTSKYDALTDSPSFARVLKEIAQDFHLLYDVATGENGIAAADTMNHDGTALGGALLNAPLFVQPINVRISAAETDLSTIGGEVYILACPVQIPAGQEYYRFEVYTYDVGPEMTIEVYNTAGAIESTQQMSYQEGTGTHFAVVRFETTGVLRYVMVRCAIDTNKWDLRGWSAVVPVLNESASTAPPDADEDNVPANVAATGVSIPVESFHDEMFLEDYPVPGWLPVTLSRSLTALIEAVTGAPVNGNVSLANADESAGVADSVNPTTSKFLCHGRAGLAAEPLVDWPMFAEAFGAVQTDGSTVVNSALTTGLVDWFAPFPVDTANSKGRQAAVYFPDFLAGASSALKCTILACNDAGKIAWSGNWQARADTLTAAGTFAGFTRLGTTPFYVVTLTALDFAPDSQDLVQLRTQKTAGAFTFGEMSVLGWAWYFDP